MLLISNDGDSVDFVQDLQYNDTPNYFKDYTTLRNIRINFEQ